MIWSPSRPGLSKLDHVVGGYAALRNGEPHCFLIFVLAKSCVAVVRTSLGL